MYFFKRLFHSNLFQTPSTSKLLINDYSKFNHSKWRIEVALFIYRLPVVAQQMTEVEKQFAEMSELADDRCSYKCDFELQLEKDAKLLEKRKQLEAEGKDLSALDEQIGISSIQLKDDWMEKCQELVKNYNLEKSHNTDEETQQSLQRKVDRKLVLLVKQRFPDAPSADYVSPWILPRLVREERDTLRQTADKCIRNIFPGFREFPFGLKVLGNAPMSHLAERYSKSMSARLGFDGSFVFLYPVLLHRKTSSPLSRVDLCSEQIVDYKWCTREELIESRITSQYKSAFNFALIE